ncbi:MAG: glycosyltransferase family 4 protein [Methylophilaceae bacterium]
MIIVTDTFEQTNGVSTTYKNIKRIARSRNLAFKVIHPSLFKWMPMPFYPEIQLATQPCRLWRLLNRINPPQLHIATEGILGLVARTWCRVKKKPFTTSYHTQFPEYLNVYCKIPLSWTYRYLRRFHAPAKTTFVTTETMRKQLAERGFEHLTVWTRGVSEQLKSEKQFQLPNAKLKVLNVGRVSKEKNLDALCAYENTFDISIVGDGPYTETLKSKYKNVTFLGYKYGKELADIYTEHDIFAFPSRTDTFGIVMIEAMCNGLPVAGYKVPGPIDVIEPGVTGYMNDELQNAITQCKQLDRQTIKEIARKQWSWANCFDIFSKHFHA